MNFLKRIAEMAQNRLNSDIGRGTDNISDAPPLVTPSPNENLIPYALSMGAPTRRFNARREHLPRRNPIGSGDQPPTSSNSRHSFQLQIARNLIDFARGYPNTRNHHRRTLLAKVNAPRLSAAHPQNFPNSYADEHIRPYKLDIVMARPVMSRTEIHQYAWNPNDRSLNVFVKEDNMTMHRHPVPQSTDGIRGKVGFSSGFHVWKLVWPEKQRGTHPVVGVATKNAILHAPGYGSLLGANAESYGWDINVHRCHHDSKHSKPWSYPAYRSSDFVVPKIFYCILDMDEGYMAFATSTEYLGVAFRGLKGKTLYPVISAVWGHCEVAMRYIGGMKPEPPPLVDICRKLLRVEMGESRLDRTDELGLPHQLERYVLGLGS